MKGNSACNSPPKAPRYNFTFTVYDTMIPNASRWSGFAILHKKHKLSYSMLPHGSFYTLKQI